MIMGLVEPGSMTLRDFVEDSLTRTGDQIRESTRREYRSAMEDFIRVIGNVDYRRVCLKEGRIAQSEVPRSKEDVCILACAAGRLDSSRSKAFGTLHASAYE